MAWLSTSVCLAEDPVQLWFPLHDGDVRNYLFVGRTLEERVSYDGLAGTRKKFRITEGTTTAQLSTGDGVLRLDGITDVGFVITFSPGLQILTADTALRGGSLKASSQFLVGGTVVPGGLVSLTSTISLIGPVTVPAGSYLDCRELKWDLRVSVPGKSAALLSQAFVLAPEVGPIREAAIDDNQNFLGWWELASGTVGGQDVGSLTNRIAPSFTEQPTNQTALVGQTLALSATATGNPPPAYQWQRKPVGLSVWSNVVDSSVFNGAVSPVLLLQNTTTNLSGDQFRCVVTNSLGSVTSRVALITILALPSLVQQPTNLTVIVGKPATFSVTAAGTAPLSYQWLKGGAKIAGATSKSFSIAATKSTDAADYSVTVTNLAGRITSSNATLTVLVPPTITQGPSNLTVIVGQSAEFRVTATANTPLSYQWQKGTVTILGATGPTYQITNAQVSDAATYSVVVTNVAGKVTSAGAILKVLAPPQLTTQPTNLTVNLGKPATFSVVATGTAPLSYQWLKGGIRIAGATAQSFSIPAVKATDVAEYSVIVTNLVGIVSSTNATLTVLFPPTITQGPTNLTVIVGEPATFSVTATANAALSYQWRKGTANILGATGAVYTLPVTKTTDAATYSVVVTNVAGKATSGGATLNVLVPPQLTSQPTNLTVNLGKTATFNVVATGTAPLSYQWLKGGIRITGAIAQSFSIAAVKATDAAEYSVTVTNLAGMVSSTHATLSVIFPPTLTQGPTNLTVVVGEPATFSVTATANAPLSYQWRKGTANLLGATGAVYTLPVTKTTDAGSYSVVVSDRAGSVTSAAAVLTVKPAVLPVITQQPTNQIVPLGQSATFVVGASARPAPTYQWSKNKVALAGATNAILTLHNIAASDAGSYTVLVKNTAGGVTSAVAELVVGPPMSVEFLDLGSLLLDGSFQIRWIGGQGMITLEASDDLTNWRALAVEEASSEFRTYVDPDARTISQRFYRLRSER